MIMLNERMRASPTPHSPGIDEMLRRTAVIIPARNEERSLPAVLADLPPVARVIVVNNGSTDSTPTVARNAGAYVVDERIAGYGRACRRGLATLRNLMRRARRSCRRAERLSSLRVDSSLQDVEYVAFLDADYSDHPELLSELVAPIHRGQADFVLGSRLRGNREPGAMPPASRLGNRLACWLMWLIWRGKYTDLGPFRAIRLRHLNRLRMQDTNFGWTVEMQVKALRHGLRIVEIPVPYRRRIGTSKISGTLSGTVKAGYKILFTIGKFAIFR